MPTVLITGANRGIGLEFAQQYAADGWHVIAACRNPDKADALQALAKTRSAVQIERLDVGDSASIKSLAAKVKEAAIDVLINNAGIVTTKFSPAEAGYFDLPEQKFGTLDAEAWLEVLRIDTIAPLMVSEALTENIARGTERKIIMISSRFGSIELNRPDAIAYSSAKAALNMAMRKMALTLQARHITVISFHPGWVKTDMGGHDADLTPSDSVASMRLVIGGLTAQNSGQFLRYDGQTIPW